MNLAETMTEGFRNAFIVIGFVCIFVGLIVRDTGETSKGLGMALLVVGASMVAFATVLRIFGWW